MYKRQEPVDLDGLNYLAGKNMDFVDVYKRQEYERMTVRLNMNCPAAQVLEEFSDRVRQEDVENFVNVFAAAKVSGGDSISIIRNAVRTIDVYKRQRIFSRL